MNDNDILYIPIKITTLNEEKVIAWPIQVRVPQVGETLEYEGVGYFIDAINWHIDQETEAVTVQLVCM